MKRYAVLLAFLLAVPGFSQEKNTDVFPLSGKCGLGVEDVSGVGYSLAIRYWLSDKTAFDAIAGQNFGNDTFYDFGIGMRINLAQPSKFLMVQGVGKLGYTHTSYQPIFYSSNDEWDAYVGIGFEAFLPFCDWISLGHDFLFDFSLRPSPIGEARGVFSPWQSDNLTNLSIRAYF